MLFKQNPNPNVPFIEQLAAALSKIRDPNPARAGKAPMPSGINQGTFTRRDSYEQQGTKYGTSLLELLARGGR